MDIYGNRKLFFTVDGTAHGKLSDYMWTLYGKNIKGHGDTTAETLKSGQTDVYPWYISIMNSNFTAGKSHGNGKNRSM